MLFGMILVIAMLASCGGGDEGGTTGGGGGTTGGGEEDVVLEITYPGISWDKTEIRYELTKDDCGGELTSGCERYYAGAGMNNNTELDYDIRQRNLAAATAANVSVKFSYAADPDNGVGWGSNINRVVLNASSTSSDTPDIYCNYAYDITCAQLRGAFANLKSTEYTNGNWFRFTDSDYNPVSDNYFDAEAGEGYFYDYMKSLSLSDSKMYCLASNYCTDLVRAFLVVPVNITMLNQISPENSYTGDMENYEDFYNLVWRDEDRAATNKKYAEGWTYNVLAYYASKVYNGDTTSDSYLAGTLGFIAGTSSGLVSSGFLYTSNVQIITKTETSVPGIYEFSYPRENAALDVFATAITQLFREGASNGVVTVNSDTARVYDPTARGDLTMIRNKFSKNELLFGGIIAVGSLEETVYQNMRIDGDGFGILPVPLYRSTDENGNTQEYQTLVHNIARIVAIAKSTTEFSQCSAYLDYLSRTSADILDSYYTEKLEAAAGGTAGDQNSKMLTYIRNHVRDCFDKTFEDSITNLYANTTDSSAATNSKWHEILGNKYKFIYDSFKADYDANRASKQAALDAVVKDWNSNS